MRSRMKYELVLVYLDGKMNKIELGIRLGLGRRRINQILKDFDREDENCLEHKLKNKSPVNRTSREVETKLVALKNMKYNTCNFSHFQELLFSIEKIEVSYSSLYRILNRNGVVSKKSKRKKKSGVEHPNRPARECFGELLQMDASIHLWFGESKTALHIAIDDATKQIVGGYFDTYETLNGYYKVLEQILNNHGIPACFYTDRRSIFEYKRVKNTLENDTSTQFKTCCSQLGIDIKTTSVPQAKGKVERKFQDLQDRLIVELELHNINTIEAANKYLQEYITTQNKRFAHDITSFKNVFRPTPHKDTINLTLSVFEKRKILPGLKIKFHNKEYRAYENNKEKLIPIGQTVILLLTLDKNIVILHKQKIYQAVELYKYSDSIDNNLNRKCLHYYNLYDNYIEKQ